MTNELVTGFLDDNTWNHYTYQSFIQDNILISINQTTTFGDCDLYVRWDNRPTRWEFDYFHIAMTVNFTLPVPNQPNKILYIGLYGWSSVGYNMKVMNTVACPSCVHGTCTTEGICQCDDPWIGAACDFQPTTLRSTEHVTHTISANQWVYYNFISNQSTVVFALREENPNPFLGFVYLLISEGTTPDLWLYDHGDTSSSKPMHLINLYLDDRPGETINWVIGVYGTSFIIEPVTYHFVVWQT